MNDQTQAFRSLTSAHPKLGGKTPRGVKLLVSLSPCLPVSLSPCLLVCLFAMPGTVAAQPPPKEYAVTYHEPFKGPPKKAEDFTLIGAGAGKYVKFEPEGLRITMSDSKSRARNGVATAFGITGDFEITVRYDILLDEREPANSGTIGVTVNLSTPGDNWAKMERNKPMPELNHIMTARYMRKDADSKIVARAASFSVKEKSGQLRLVRKGADITYYVSEGLAKEFTELTTHPFGADDVKDIQIYGGTTAALDVRFTDLQIRAASLPRQANPPQIPIKYGVDYLERFKGPPKKAEDFTLMGADASKCVKFEPEGLRITMPAGKTRAPTGVATRFGLTGDFEITVRYEILQEPEPVDAGSLAVGTRISLRVNLNAAGAHEASIRRKVSPNLPAHILTFRSLRRVGDSEPDKMESTFPVKEKTGKFRLVRSGADITYYLAEGPDGDFTRLATYSVGADDVKNVQIYGQSSSPTAALDARFTQLHIRAGSLPRQLAAPKSGKGGDSPKGDKGNETSPPKVEKASGPTIPTKDYAQTYFQSFQGNGAKPAGWEFTTAPAEEFMKFERDGLRMTLPAGQPNGQPTAGIRSAFGVKGDFEITLNFEILKENPPAEGGKFGTRLSLAVAVNNPLLDTPQGEAATLSRSLSIKGERTFTTWMRTREYPASVSGGKPTTATTGRLRFVRSGDELFFLASAGADEPFIFIRKYRFGAEDLKRVAITGATGDEKALLDVRVTDLRIRADGIPRAPAADAVAEPQGAAAPSREGGREWLVAIVLVGIAITIFGVLAVGGWFFLRKRGGAANEPSAETNRTSVSFACPENMRKASHPRPAANARKK